MTREKIVELSKFVFRLAKERIFSYKKRILNIFNTKNGITLFMLSIAASLIASRIDYIGSLAIDLFSDTKKDKSQSVNYIWVSPKFLDAEPSLEGIFSKHTFFDNGPKDNDQNKTNQDNYTALQPNIEPSPEQKPRPAEQNVAPRQLVNNNQDGGGTKAVSIINEVRRQKANTNELFKNNLSPIFGPGSRIGVPK